MTDHQLLERVLDDLTEIKSEINYIKRKILAFDQITQKNLEILNSNLEKLTTKSTEEIIRHITQEK